MNKDEIIAFNKKVMDCFPDDTHNADIAIVLLMSTGYVLEDIQPHEQCSTSELSDLKEVANHLVNLGPHALSHVLTLASIEILSREHGIGIGDEKAGNV
jgi:hypothetical protein